MKGFLKWFNKNAKMKRWIFLILVGTILLCYGISSIIVYKTIPDWKTLIKIALSFIAGFSIIVVSIIHIQRRTLELLVEDSDTRT